MTSLIVAIAPDGTLSPLAGEYGAKRKVPREEAHRMSKKRAERECSRVTMDFDLRGHRIEVEPFTPDTGANP